LFHGPPYGPINSLNWPAGGPPPVSLLWLAGPPAFVVNASRPDACCFMLLLAAGATVWLSYDSTMVNSSGRCSNAPLTSPTLLANASALCDSFSVPTLSAKRLGNSKGQWTGSFLQNFAHE